ncbi:unnamed protein product [Cuscuta campestris]|uniref:COP1-interacting protein 7 n=1 Tax=Cuscuta campestris TaxID=132261 RepID=A0A484LKL8_9ASTE|nr:unnamed protein product [Cuscuta campestris]
MKSSTRLDSVVFQLTPTRTRCDLIIIANEKKEKIASGLLDPFLAHLKTAQDQVAKAGYSIVLEPKPQSDASWFTKGTVERFVRFVSTPEILERVHTIESEIFQIEEAITIHRKNDIQHGNYLLCLQQVEHHLEKSLGTSEDNKLTSGVNEEKAIVLYEPGAHQHEKSNSASQGGNSRAQLLKVLKTRKSVLQKEQGMAFARAVAAGFDIDYMVPLLSFADCFGASRLRDASLRFMELWKKKHETGQWLEMGAAEAIASQSDMFVMNASDSNTDLASEADGKLNTDGTAGERQRTDQQVPSDQQQFFQNKFSQPMFPPWAMNHPASVMPVLQPYSVHGVPYYQTYSGNDAFYHLPYLPHMEDSSADVVHRTRQKGWSMDGKDTNSEESLDDSDLDNEDPQYHELRKNSRRSRKRHSGKVVIQNINYISKTKNSTNSDSGSDSDTDSNADGEDLLYNISQSSKTKSSRGKHLSNLSYDKEEYVINEKMETDSGQWLAFQNLLFREKDDGNHSIKDHMLAEKEGRTAMPRTANDEFIVNGRVTDLHLNNSLDPLVENGGNATNELRHTFSNGIADESFLVTLRSMASDDAVPDNRTIIELASELPATLRNTEINSHRESSLFNYEPNDLGLVLGHGTQKCSGGYDPSWDSEMQVCLRDNESHEKGKKEVQNNNLKKGPQKPEDRRSKATAGLDKKRVGGPIKKGNISKSSPLDDARVRAERIRSFKSDIQKMKKEKEEADLKRLEALKLERQKRIAARGSSSSTLSASSQTRGLATKVSPNSVKGSKFSDAEPGSSSPLQISKRRTPIGSNDSQKASKSSRRSDGNLANNRLTKSATSLSVSNKETSSVTPDSKTSRARFRRLSEPKTLSSVASKPRGRNSELASKSKLNDVNESKKISALMDLDKKKAATLPELKIRTSKVKDSGPPFMKSRKLSQESQGDEIIVEKTVVMLECEKQSLPSPSGSVKNLVKHNLQSDIDDRGAKIAVASDYAFIDAPPSPFEGFIRGTIPGRLLEQLNSQEVGASSVEETPKFANIDGAGRPYYQAPYARVSSLEEPCTGNSASPEPDKVNVDDVKTITATYNVQEASEKTQSKETSKGFKRLLKFGKKNQSPVASDKNLEPDSKRVVGVNQGHTATSTASSNEVYTLKNLISQDEVPNTGNAVQKSRHFSLLSPFRSKTTEKKLAS